MFTTDYAKFRVYEMKREREREIETYLISAREFKVSFLATLGGLSLKRVDS